MYNDDIEFTFYFNRRRQWIDVTLHDVSPQTFVRRNGTRWGYYQSETLRNDRRGKFGEIHLVASRVTPDLAAHELFHLLADWLRCKGMTITPQNEERLAWLFDEMTRNFWREYGKVTG